jgi:aldehyde dehydrogenase (NAD+)
MKPACLELGGKSANVIFDDADLDTACSHGAFTSIAVLSGQGCALPTRMLVHAPIYDAVVGRVAEIAKAINVGDPFDPSTVSGPVVSKAALNRIMGMIERAKLDGARLVTGGARLEGALADGYFIEPTVFADMDPASELAQREVFGPVLAITPFANEAQAIAIANGTPYGLSAYIQTADLRRAHRVADELVTGEVLVNGAINLGVHRPFGGVGLSGFGKEGGRAGLEEFLQVKSVAIV